MKKALAFCVGLSLIPSVVLGFVGDPTYTPPVDRMSIEDLHTQVLNEQFDDGDYGITLVDSNIERADESTTLRYDYSAPGELFGIIPTAWTYTVEVTVLGDGETIVTKQPYLFQNINSSVQSRYLVDRINTSIPTVLANYDNETVSPDTNLVIR